jgi:hypothetical protein
MQAALSISKFDDDLDLKQFVRIRERADVSGAFRGFDPERPSSYSRSWAENNIWRTKP